MTTPAAAPDTGRGRQAGRAAGTLILLPYTGKPRSGWRHLAECDDTTADLFFAEPADPRYEELTREAKRICAGCTVRTDCLAWALVHGERHGVWGGLDEDQRDRITQRRSTP